MKKRMKRVAAAALAGVMAFSLAACGGSKDAQQQSTESQDGKTKIKITWWGGQSRHDYTQQLLDLYTKSHPDVEFEAVPSGWDGYFDKLSTQAASGSMPDIVQMDYLYISTYAKNNSVADLQPYIDNGTIDVSNVDEKILNSGKIDGKMAGMVLSSSILAVGYNPEVLSSAGVEEPKGDWTWDDFAKISETISKKTGKASAMTSSGVVSDTNIFNYWVRQNGASLFSEDGKSLGYEDDAITASYFQYWKDLMDKDVSPDPDEMSQIVSLGKEANPVVTGDAAFNFEWNNYAAQMSTINDKLKITTPPVKSADDKGLWIKPGMFFSVSENSKVKDACAEFINWFINSEEANDIMMAERGTPISSKVREHMINSGKLNEQQVEMFEYVDKVSEISGDTPAPDPQGISEVNEAFAKAGNSVFYGQASAEDAAKAFRQEANAILERNNK